MDQVSMMAGGMPAQPGNHMNNGMQRPQGNATQQMHAAVLQSLQRGMAEFAGGWQATHDIRDRSTRIMHL
jgi:hypothetical protein